MVFTTFVSETTGAQHRSWISFETKKKKVPAKQSAHLNKDFIAHSGAAKIPISLLKGGTRNSLLFMLNQVT